jgi:hypothetical protein
MRGGGACTAAAACPSDQSRRRERERGERTYGAGTTAAHDGEDRRAKFRQPDSGKCKRLGAKDLAKFSAPRALLYIGDISTGGSQ